MYRRLPGSNTSHAYPSRSQRWLGPALVAGSGALLLGALLTIALSTNALLLFAPSDLTSSPLFIAGRPPRLLYDWTDPNLVDSQEERALARDCVFDSPLDHLALWPALQNASKLPAPSSNGLLNATGWSGPEGWHPLLLLIKEGEERFKAKLASQSRTLAEAEDEYRRRNGGRRPPSGFEVWWNFASSHGVLFPDEHAGSELLRPFQALSPTERRRRLELASREAQVVAVEGSPKQALVRITNNQHEGLMWAPLKTSSGRSGYVPRETRMKSRTKAHLAVLQPIQHLLPNFTFVINNADQPVVLLDPKVAGELEDPIEPAGHQIDWLAYCSRRKNASHWIGTEDGEINQGPIIMPRAEREGVTFVRDVARSGDPCANTNLLEQHGFYLQDTGGPNPDLLPLTHRQLLPIISLSSTPEHSDLLGVPVGIEGWIEHVGDQDVDWEWKVDQVYWRGSATGMYNHVAPGSDQPRWLQSHRPRLSLFANDHTKSPDPPVELDRETGGIRTALTTWGTEWKRWLNVHLASSIFWRIFSWWPETGQQCSWSDGTCRSLGWRFFFVGKDPSGTADRFKVSLDVDGNAWSARFPRLLASKSLVLKSTAFTEWNAGTFPAHYGYIPVQNDYADLESILSFLHEPGMDEVARRMALVGRCYKSRTFRVVDMQAYLLRLYIEMADLFAEEEP